jgi:hypothetical protein
MLASLLLHAGPQQLGPAAFAALALVIVIVVVTAVVVSRLQE